MLDRVGDGLAHQRIVDEAEAVLFPRLHLVKLVAAGDQCGEFALQIAGRRCGPGLHPLPEERQQGGVDGIGFGNEFGSLAKRVDAKRMDEADGDVRRMEGIEEAAFVAAGGFADDVESWVDGCAGG